MEAIFAGIVLFNPEISRLKENITHILGQVDRLILVDNGSNNKEEIQSGIQNFNTDKILYIDLHKNKGIAAALNVIAESTESCGVKWVLTLDQDTVCKDDKRGKVFGDVFEINYREQAANVAQNSVAPDHDRLTFADGYVLDAPCRSSFDAAMALVGEHGGVKTRQTLPKDAEALAEVLSKQKTRRDRLPDAGRTETLSPLPVAELRKYEAVKKAHPDALVCFAQNGYFELYGKDAEKAAPLLGTKLLEKKVRGKPSMPVTGFRESAWVAGSHKLWKSGADVFLSKDSETFKELKAADYIPVGATLNVDGIKCRIDAVDFAADEVRLTNIEDKNRPIRFSESIQYVRAYVEDAGTAIYDTIPKKPAARESIRDKLKSAQKAQPTHTPKPQKSKGKDMEL